MSGEYEVYMATDVKEYAGEWVAIKRGKVIAHGKHFKAVVEEAKRRCKQIPFIAKVPEAATMIF